MQLLQYTVEAEQRLEADLETDYTTTETQHNHFKTPHCSCSVSPLILQLLSRLVEIVDPLPTQLSRDVLQVVWRFSF